MKKLLLLGVSFVFSLFVMAEEKVSEYSMSYFGGYGDQEVFDIEASSVKNEKFSFYIYCSPKGGKTDKIGFILKSKEVKEFCEQLNAIKPKFEEWSKTAKDNNVTNYDKKFDTDFSSTNAFFLYGSKWCFSYSFKFKPYFKVTNDGECLVVFNIGELTSVSNRFMTNKGFMMVFKSSQEIDAFIQALDVDKVFKKGEEKAKENDLFK